MERWLNYYTTQTTKDTQMAKFATEKFTSPKGRFGTAFIDRPNKKGKLKDIIVVPKAEAAEATARIDKFWKDNRPTAAKPRPIHKGYMLATDEDTGEETGDILFIFSTNPTFPSGDKKIVKVFTAKAPVREVSLNGKLIGRDSIGRGIGTLAIYEYDGDYGVSLYLDAISLSKFAEYVGGASASDVTTDDDADDIDLGETVVDTSAVQDEGADTPRV